MSAHDIFRCDLEFASTWTPAFAGVTIQGEAEGVFPQPASSTTSLIATARIPVPTAKEFGLGPADSAAVQAGNGPREPSETRNSLNLP